MKKVTIKIKAGKVSADFEGFQGKGCEVLAKQIHPEELNEEEKELKPEYHYTTQTLTQDNEQHN